MTVRAEWDNTQKTIMRLTFEGAWTWDEYFTSAAFVNQQIIAENHVVDVIVDLTANNIMPSGALTQGKKAMIAKPANNGITILVGVNPVLQGFYKMFSGLYQGIIRSKKVNMVMAATMEAAYKILEAERMKNVSQE